MGTVSRFMKWITDIGGEKCIGQVITRFFQFQFISEVQSVIFIQAFSHVRSQSFGTVEIDFLVTIIRNEWESYMYDHYIIESYIWEDFFEPGATIEIMLYQSCESDSFQTHFMLE